MRMTRTVTVAAALAGTFAFSASGSIMIDDFSVDQIVPSIPASGGFMDNTITGPAPNIIGTTRRLFVQTFDGSGEVVYRVEHDRLRISQPAGTFTTSVVEYNGGGAGLGGVDLTEGGAADRFSLVGNTNGNVQVEVIAFSSGFIEISRRQVNMGAGAFHLDMLFGAFIPDSGANPVNFSSITKLWVGIHIFNGPGQATEFRLGEVRTIPAPAGAALLAAPLLALRRRRA